MQVRSERRALSTPPRHQVEQNQGPCEKRPRFVRLQHYSPYIFPVTASVPCSQCQTREGTGNLLGLISREGVEAVQEAGKRISFFSCKECGNLWSLVEEIGTGRRPIFIRDVLP